MGYSTDYKIDVGPFETEEDAEFFEFKFGKLVNYETEAEIGLSTGDKHTDKYYLKLRVTDARWYEWRTDLNELSVNFPNVTIDVMGEGEESGDIWKSRFRNGEDEFVEAIMTFPDFKILTD